MIEISNFDKLTRRPDTTKLDKHINPFVYSLEIKTKQFDNHKAFKKDENLLVFQTYIVETTPKVNLYVKPEHRVINNNLNTPAKSLLLWILYTIETNEDYLWINKERYMKETDTSLNTYKKGLENLIRYGFLQGTVVRDTYWFNPEFFFKGDRKSKYPKNVILENENKK